MGELAPFAPKGLEDAGIFMVPKAPPFLVPISGELPEAPWPLNEPNILELPDAPALLVEPNIGDVLDADMPPLDDAAPPL